MPRALRIVPGPSIPAEAPSEPLVLDRQTKEAIAALCADLVRLRGLETQPNPVTVAKVRDMLPGMRARIDRLAIGLGRVG